MKLYNGPKILYKDLTPVNVIYFQICSYMLKVLLTSKFVDNYILCYAEDFCHGNKAKPDLLLNIKFI